MAAMGARSAPTGARPVQASLGCPCGVLARLQPLRARSIAARPRHVALSAGAGGVRLAPRAARAPAARAAERDAAVPLRTIDATGEPSMQVWIDNAADASCSTVRVTGPGQSDCLLLLVNGLFAAGFNVLSSNYSNNDGIIEFNMRVVAEGGGQLQQDQIDAASDLIERLVASAPMSTRPAIYGIVSEHAPASSDGPGALGESDALHLERTATEVAVAAARFAAAERRLRAAGAKGDAAQIASAEQGRSEAASLLERLIAQIEALVTSRRALGAPAPAADQAGSAAELMKRQLLGSAAAAPAQQTGTGPGAGDGYQILLQAFNWESHKEGYYRQVAARAQEWADIGFTAAWLPPPSDSVSPQGYLPRDLYCLDSAYGSEAELRRALSALRGVGIKAIADVVINHRCASFQGDGGKWNKFGGRLAWGPEAICSNNPQWGGRGARKSSDDYAAAPNIDHSQERIRDDVIEWLQYLRTVGFDGWRFDFVRGYSGGVLKQYIDATVPAMAFGEYWDTCDYTDSVLNYNQDAHRQRTINWCDSTGGTAAAFDFTTKGILQEALGRSELWRLVDAQGRSPGMLGMWPSRAIPFLDNHDTGSTLQHWPFPSQHLQEGYAYILLSPGTPCVFVDHVTGDSPLAKLIRDLVRVRKEQGLHARSKVTVRKAVGDVYAHTVDDKVALKLGRGDWSPNAAGIDVGQKEWRRVANGHNCAVWVAIRD